VSSIALAQRRPTSDTHRVLEKVVFAVALTLGVVLWVLGAWQVFDSNTTRGALLVLAGAVTVIGAIAWRVREPSAGASGLFDAIIEFLSRAP
jgi:hypothetical protein